MSEILVSTENFHCVNNAVVYDLKESLIAAGYPMATSTKDIKDIDVGLVDYIRAQKLSKATLNGNQAHDQFLSGIRIAFDLTCSNKMWVEAERYRFLTFVSSQSTMHRITKFDLNNQYNKYVDPRIINTMTEKIEEYNTWKEEPDRIMNDLYINEEEYNKRLQEIYLEILYSNPAGFELTARMTTNYRCLKNIYKQRKDHRLPEWREFCSWIETLPWTHELILCDI